jgi:uncharacterized membrane protein
MARLRRYFFTGLAVLFPIGVTIFAVLKLFQFADGLLGSYINSYFKNHLGYTIPGLGLLLTVLLILLAGYFSSHVVGSWVLHRVEESLERLPLIKHIYPSVKQLTKFVLSEGRDEEKPAPFRRAVLVQYPRDGIYSIAFVTNEHQTAALDGTLKTVLTLLIPTPPSPLTGPIIFVKKDDAVPLDITIEDAFKLVVSDGVVAGPLKTVVKPG